MKDHVDRFQAAVKVLASHGHIKQRLIQAYEDNLDEINEEELPIALKQDFADIKYLMHRVTPLNGEGSICASVRKMSVTEASDLAVALVSLYAELTRQADGGQTHLPLHDDNTRRVPPFLVKSL